MEKIIKPQAGAQTIFASSNADIAVYGGTAGCGKTFIDLLVNIFNFYKYNYFTGVIFRRNLTDVKQAGGLWQETLKLIGSDKNLSMNSSDFLITNNLNKSIVKFAHLEHEDTVYKYQGMQAALISFDELTHFKESQFWYMMSRNRPLMECNIPKGMIRATTNPDADSWVRNLIDWWIDDDGLPIIERSGVKRYFYRENDSLLWFDSINAALRYKEKQGLNVSNGLNRPKSFTFVPAKPTDNKLFYDTKAGIEYQESLRNLSVVERERLLYGNWNIKVAKGLIFKEHWFSLINESELPTDFDVIVRGWDLAATEQKDNNDPDYTATVKIGKKDNKYYILHYSQVKMNPSGVTSFIKNTVDTDGYNVMQLFEQEGGSGGKFTYNMVIKPMLSGYPLRALKPTTSKKDRAMLMSVHAEQGNIFIVNSHNTKEYLQNLAVFPEGRHDDFVDASTIAFNFLTKSNSSKLII